MDTSGKINRETDVWKLTFGVKQHIHFVLCYFLFFMKYVNKSQVFLHNTCQAH